MEQKNFLNGLRKKKVKYNIFKNDLFDIQMKKKHIEKITLVAQKVNIYWLFFKLYIIYMKSYKKYILYIVDTIYDWYYN